MIIAISGKKQSGKSELTAMLKYIIESTIKNKLLGRSPFKDCTFNNYCESDKKPVLHLTPIYVRQDQFAAPLKAMCAGLLDCKIEAFEDNEFKKAYSNFKTNVTDDDHYKDALVNLTNREVLIHFGDIVRKHNPFYFVEAALKRHDDAQKLSGENSIITIISDLRLLDEMNVLNEREDVVTIRLHRNINDGQHIEHDTENGLDNYPYWDFEVYNQDWNRVELWNHAITIYELLPLV